MAPPTPSRDFLAAQVRWAMGRGLPPEAAEDVVHASWEKAVQGFDPRLGSFEAYMQKVVRNACAYWWRDHGRTRRATAALRLVPSEADTARQQRAADHQEAILEALSEEERRIFAAWALQKHLGKGRVTSEDMSRSLGLDARAYENAKRRLKDQLGRLLDRFGWSVHELLFGERDVDQTG